MLATFKMALLAVGIAQPSKTDSLKNLFFLLILKILLSETTEYFIRVLHPPVLIFLPLLSKIKGLYFFCIFFFYPTNYN